MKQNLNYKEDIYKSVKKNSMHIARWQYKNPTDEFKHSLGEEILEWLLDNDRLIKSETYNLERFSQELVIRIKKEP